MSKINILPVQVYNRIAAGEVVDRPYSVVKELVENSIDAGATEIEITVEGGGKQLIRVVDNGEGISRDDLHSAFLPHATSKISKADDLNGIMTLGFRGEAVASIASVSKMTITSKRRDEECFQLSSDGGLIGEIQPASGKDGTDVQVEMLFYNTPVRFKFLKSDRSEESEITNYVARFILDKPQIAFTYYLNGKKVLQSFGGGEEEAFVSVYGAAFMKECFHINAEKHGIKVRGFIGNQNFSKSNKTYESIFLNGRYITNQTLSSAITNAYASYLMKRQYPVYVLYIDVPPETVDVNVHPNKADVRFADNRIMYGCVYTIISSILDGNTSALEYVVNKDEPIKEEVQEVISIPAEEEKQSISERIINNNDTISERKENKESNAVFTIEDARKELEIIPPKKIDVVEEDDEEDSLNIENTNNVRENVLRSRIPYENINYSSKRAEPSVNRNEEIEEKDYFEENKKYLNQISEKAKQNRIDINTCTYAGKLFNTYIIYERRDEAYIIDQHAAHERLIFNKLKEQMKERKVIQQPMLLSYMLEVNVFESEFIKENIENIREMGFDIEEFGENTFKISAVPVDLQSIDLNEFFKDILSDISGYRSIKLEDLLKDKLATAACKAAVKGGMDLTQNEIERLFSLMDGDMGLKCPHGRPVVVKMTKYELEKMFKRIV